MNFPEYVKQQIDLVEYISRDETLTSIGNTFRGGHLKNHTSESNTCLTVDPVKQLWYCFHCKTGGDIFTYLEIRDNCNFATALSNLCNEYNIPRPEWTPEQKAEFERKRKEQKQLRPLLRECFAFYNSTMTEEQRQYFLNRCISNDTIDSELLGYASGGDVLVKRMREKHSPAILPKLVKIGMAVYLGGAYHDRYSQRYLFPYWHRNEIVYSIGRRFTDDSDVIADLPNWNKGKYIKHLLHKKEISDSAVKHVIWGEDIVRASSTVVVAEGIVDALLAKQMEKESSELDYSVISAITPNFSGEQIKRLPDLTSHAVKNIIINDNEKSKAGEIGALKTAKMLIKEGRRVKIATIPIPDNVDKIDLADFVKNHGGTKESVEDFKKLLEDAVDPFTFELREIDKDIDRMELAGKVEELLKEALTLGKDKDLLRMFIDHKLKATFDLKDKDIRNYQSMLVRLSKKHEADTKKHDREERQREHQQKMDNLKETDFAQYLKELIEETRTQPYKKTFQIKKSVSHIVIKDMIAHGKFYRTKGNLYYYFNNNTLELVNLGDIAFTHYVNHRYGLNKSETEYEYLLHDLETHTGYEGELTEVYRFAHYDIESKTLYIDRNDHQMYKLNGEAIGLKPNGADGVLFITDDTAETFELVDIGDQTFIEPLIIEPINFVGSADVVLSKDEQQYLYGVWIESLFFEELLHTKPLQLFLGEKGSGKSTTQRKTGKWLIGSNFELTGLKEEDDFDATVSNNYLCCFDNVDCYKKWINDRLSQIATGGKIELRELYTTNKNATYYPRCFITLNSREPKFKRDDVVDRLLLFRVQRFKDFGSEKEIYKKIADNRDQLWSELLHENNGIVKALREDNEPFTSGFRMADFADLGWRISKSQGAGDLWLELLDKMSKDKSEFLLLDDPIFLCLENMLIDNYKLVNLTTGTLYSKMKNYAKDNDEISLGHIENARSLGQRLSHMMSELRAYFDIERIKVRNRWYYTIRQKEK